MTQQHATGHKEPGLLFNASEYEGTVFGRGGSITVQRGPIVNLRQAERAQKILDDSVAPGARVIGAMGIGRLNRSGKPASEKFIRRRPFSSRY